MHINIWTLIIVPEDYLNKETKQKQNIVKTNKDEHLYWKGSPSA